MASDTVRSSARLLSPFSSDGRVRSRSRSRIRTLTAKSRAFFYKHFRKSDPSVRKQDVDDNRFERAELEWTKLLDPYISRPLSGPSCIRLLAIKADADFDAPVEAKVEEIDLDDEHHHPYVALSHAWGPTPVLDRILICDGKRHGITGRIDYALQRIRRKAGEDEHRSWIHVWIDAVCIDQSESPQARAEKSKQVAMMHTVFGSAKEVIVDLGHAFRYSHMLPSSVDEFERLGMESMESGDEDTIKTIMIGVSDILDSEENCFKSEEPVQMWLAIGKLFQREWPQGFDMQQFSRVWTLQESVLSCKATFMIGEKLLGGNSVERLVKLASFGDVEIRNPLVTGLVSLMGLGATTGLQKMQLSLKLQQRRATSSSWRMRLVGACALSGLFESTDPRDFVYAIVALIGDMGAFRIDYTESAAALSRRAGLCILQEYGNNLFLHAAAGIRSAHGDTHASWGMELGSRFKFLCEDSKIILDRNRMPYSAGGGAENTLRFCICNEQDHANCILAKAYVCDSIHSISEPFPSTTTDDPRFPERWKSKYNQRDCWVSHPQTVLTWVEQAVVKTIRTSSYYPQVSLSSDVVWRTIMHDRTYRDDGRLPAGLRLVPVMEKTLKFYTLHRAGYKELGYNPDGQPTYKEAIDYTIEWFSVGLHARMQGVDPSVADHARKLMDEGMAAFIEGGPSSIFGWQRMLERRICVTVNGLVGSVHQSAQVGDHIMVFEGVNMPFLLRKNGCHYRIVGSCYIEGMMDGEAVKENPEWTEIHIA